MFLSNDSRDATAGWGGHEEWPSFSFFRAVGDVSPKAQNPHETNHQKLRKSFVHFCFADIKQAAGSY